MVWKFNSRNLIVLLCTCRSMKSIWLRTENYTEKPTQTKGIFQATGVNIINICTTVTNDAQFFTVIGLNQHVQLQGFSRNVFVGKDCNKCSTVDVKNPGSAFDENVPSLPRNVFENWNQIRLKGSESLWYEYKRNGFVQIKYNSISTWF